MAKTQSEWLAEALAHMQAATWLPSKWCTAIENGYPPPKPYKWQETENYKAQVALWNAAHPPLEPPPPVIPPVTGSVFAGKGLFTTGEPAATNGLHADWVALQADPEGNMTGYGGPARICWWQARPEQWIVNNAAQMGVPYIGQAESQSELDKCLALNTTGLAAKAIVGNAGSWTDQGRVTAAAQGWDLIQEWYMNAHPWEHSPDAHNYPRFVNVCFGIYSEGDPGGAGHVEQIPLKPYLDVWHGSYSVWKAEAMTPADRALFNS